MDWREQRRVYRRGPRTVLPDRDDRSGGRAGRRGQARLRPLRRPRAVPRVGPGDQPGRRHLGRADRGRAPHPQARPSASPPDGQLSPRRPQPPYRRHLPDDPARTRARRTDDRTRHPGSWSVYVPGLDLPVRAGRRRRRWPTVAAASIAVLLLVALVGRRGRRGCTATRRPRTPRCRASARQRVAAARRRSPARPRRRDLERAAELGLDQRRGDPQAEVRVRLDASSPPGTPTPSSRTARCSDWPSGVRGRPRCRRRGRGRRARRRSAAARTAPAPAASPPRPAVRRHRPRAPSVTGRSGSVRPVASMSISRWATLSKLTRCRESCDRVSCTSAIDEMRRTDSLSASRASSEVSRRDCSRSSEATVCRLFFTRWWISRIVASL